MKEEKLEHVTPIKKELRGLLEEFLAFPEYQDIFKQFAAVIGYKGNDVTKIKSVLFNVTSEGDITFSIEGMYELFLEFQLLKQLTKSDPYKQLLDQYPEAIQNIRLVAQKILNKQDIEQEDLILMFDTDGYDRRRAEIDAKARY